MTSAPLRCAFGVAFLVLLLAIGACAVTGVGVGYEGDYVGGVYEPYGYDYGGWGRGYRVGPPRRGYGRGPGARPGGRPGFGGGGGHPYHAAPPGRSMPSIPSRPRGH